MPVYSASAVVTKAAAVQKTASQNAASRRLLVLAAPMFTLTSVSVQTSNHLAATAAVRQPAVVLRLPAVKTAAAKTPAVLLQPAAKTPAALLPHAVTTAAAKAPAVAKAAAARMIAVRLPS